MGDYVLEDDGQWHEVSIDSRAIRDRVPDLEMLRAMRIGAAPRGDVDKGDWYDLDEVIIGPAVGTRQGHFDHFDTHLKPEI